MPPVQEDVQSDLLTLEAATDGAARNALALKLAEGQTSGLPEVLIRMIGREDLRDNRGTLVHALSYFDCAGHLPFLVDLMIGGNWEVAHEAFQIVDLIEEVEGDDAEQALAKTTDAIAKVGIEDWRHALLNDLLEMFD